MASLGRFLARSGEIGLPFYQILMHPTKFEWAINVGKAFEKLKAYLSSPPLLLISSVICSQRHNNMKPIYYVSHILCGPEERYSSLEKYIFCLLIIARIKPIFFRHMQSIF